MDTNKTDPSFLITNFDLIYKYIDSQIKKSNLTFYKYANYDLYLTNAMTISVKQKGYTLSYITKDKGLFVLSKRKKDNDRMIIKTNQIYSELLLKTKT